MNGRFVSYFRVRFAGVLLLAASSDSAASSGRVASELDATGGVLVDAFASAVGAGGGGGAGVPGGVTDTVAFPRTRRR